ncbi:MAG: hypothetical protein KF764_16730 [Labilithrix sp.]|nr:hypothetical protein [Labilithrix sp.]MBX3224082.1 hypothetical protein [Labilithrix sp.]
MTRRLAGAWRAVGRALGLAAIAAGCANSGERASGFVEGEPDAATAASGQFEEGGAPPGTEPVECAEATTQIYVVATDKGLYRFNPRDLSFKRIGTLGCPTGAGTFSMAIDRRGTAWVEYTDGRVYAVDTNDATCKPTSFKPGQTGFDLFGMGFALNGDDPKEGETLYVAGTGLASLDTKSFDLKFIGSLTGGRTELTSIGSKLFGFSVDSGLVSRLNKQTGATEATHRTSAILESGGFAFAHWGGSFWLFTGRTTSTVTAYSPTTDESTVMVDNTGMLIVGAGSSTCAPITPPK